MGRCTVIRWAFAAGVLCCWGCSAPNSFSPFGWMQGSTSAQTTATKDPSNPLKSADASATASGAGASTPAGASATASTDSADSSKGTPGGGFKSAPIDPALRKLMEDELKSEPADKRQQLLADWSKFDPAFIRELVENHRMARELAESHHGGQDSGWDGGGATPVKTASKEQPPQMPVFDDPTAPKDSVLHELPSTQTPVQPTAMATATAPATASPGSVSPWDDAPSTSPQSPRKAAAPTVSLAQAPVASGVAGPPAAQAGASSAKSDPWDFDSAPKTPGAAQQKPDQKQIAATPPAAPSGAPFATGAPTAPAVPKADAFADMTPIDTDPVPTPSRPKPTSVPSPQVASGNGAAPVQSASLNAFDDEPKIQPGVAAPAGVIASLQPSGSASPAVIQAAGTAATDGSGVGLASATSAAPTNQPNVPESEQPVKLSLPVDVPEGHVVTASDAGSTPAPAAQASAAARPTSDLQTPATAAAQTSGLASLPSRLLGAINTLPGTGGSRNISLPANWHDELQKIVAVAATEARQTSVGSSDAEKLAYIQKQVNLRMLYLLSGQPAQSLEPIAGLEPADQEFWQQVFWGMSSYFDHSTIADPRDRATQTIAQLRQAVNKLQEKSKLELRNVSFCNKIENYGRYERFKRDEFTAGQPVLLYAEVENFKSEQVNDGYRALLKSTIEIFDSRGTLVQKMPFAANEDQCASPRRDYYNSYEFSIPQQISLGPHTLKLTVEDQLSQKLASYSVNFTVK
jgi:hypothetical protein